ncbi:glucose PTS transporter subunit EIIB [Actinomyces gerencseriae]
MTSRRAACRGAPPPPRHATGSSLTRSHEEHRMSTAEQIVTGLGGRENISDLEPCITRLRVEVVDQEKVDEEALRAAGAFGVVRSGRVVQVVVGPAADDLAGEIAGLD